MIKNVSLLVVFVMVIISLVSVGSLPIANATEILITEIIDETSDGEGNVLLNPRGIAVDSLGNVYITGYNSHNAFKITPDREITEIIKGNGLRNPRDIAVDSLGNVYITGYISDNAFKITPDREITKIIDITGDGNGNVLFNPRGITVDSLGNVYITGYNSHNAFKITFSSDNDTADPPTDPTTNGGGSDSKHKTKPTFGIDHQTNILKINGGFSFNDKSIDITDNWHTPFEKQKIKINQTNSFTAKVFAEQKLKVQEFLFGIHRVGDAHKAELRVEVFFDYSGEIEKVHVVQTTNIVDMDSLIVETYPSNCLSNETDEKCVTTLLSMKFLEPLQDDMMAIKAIDFKRRTNITYLNDGFDISGDSLNPMKSTMIPGTEKHEGLVEVTQTAKYSDIWTAQDGREFERNQYGSFHLINQFFERHMDTGMMKNRLHSEFPMLLQEQQIISQIISYNLYGINTKSTVEDNIVSTSPQQKEMISILDELKLQYNLLDSEFDAIKLLESMYPHMSEYENFSSEVLVDSMSDLSEKILVRGIILDWEH